MTELEKVIKGLECWSKMAVECDGECKYKPSHEREMIVGECDFQRLCKDALELLKDYAKEQKNTDTPYQRIKRRWAMRRQRADATDEELKFLVELLDWMEAEDEDDEA